MCAPSASPQRIVRLTPLADVLAAIGQVPPAPAQPMDVRQARGFVLAEAVRPAQAVPAAAVAARDGWAVATAALTDASAYAPVPLPDAVWLDAGDPVPPAADAVLAPEATADGGGVRLALAGAAAGEGVVARGADAAPQSPLGRVGAALRASDAAALLACGVATVMVRAPRLSIVAAPGPRARRAAAVALIEDAVAAHGGVAQASHCDDAQALERALRAAGGDAVVTVGGTGAGRSDWTIRTVAALGRVDTHGVGIAPGETVALGACGVTPVLMLPGRLDAALAAWLCLGVPLLRRLSVATAADPSTRSALTRKIASGIGVAEIVLVRRDEGGVAPLAAAPLPLHAVARADGYVLVPPESEGFPAGAVVAVRPLP